MKFFNFKNTFLTLSIIFSSHNHVLLAREHLVIVGSGIIGAVEALSAYQESMQKNIPLKITIFEKNSSILDSTAPHIVPSLTPDEILSVIPRGPALIEKSNILFSLPGGIRVDDVPEINDSAVAQQFKNEATMYSLDEIGHQQRTKDLLLLGKMSMDLWQSLYDTADFELQEIFSLSNFNPCRECRFKKLHDGYRIDLIYNIAHAETRALNMKADYEKLGYTACTILTPSEVINLDTSLTNFCLDHATINDSGLLQWQNNTTALWRPGGCLDASIFIPQLYTYLEKRMGTNFKICTSSKVTAVQFGFDNNNENIITGLYKNNEELFQSQPNEMTSYVFCPGEAVGTLQNLGLNEPAFAGFAGAALKLNIDVPQDQLSNLVPFNHCMEVHQEGIVLAWQASLKDHKVFIGVGGTKAFYADQTPHKDQAFATNRNLLQLNMINNVLPSYISWALNRDTKGQILTQEDLTYLENIGIAERWVGVRAVAYDGFPTLGYAYKDKTPIVNARCTTHLGSGGVSFAPAAVAISRSVMNTSFANNEFTQRILTYANSCRTAQ